MNDAMTDTAYTAPAAATPGPASPSPSFVPLTSPEPGAKTAWPIQYIPINDIEYGERLRPLDPAEVDRKAESIAQIGPLQAITVAKHPSKSKAATRLGPFTCSRQDYTAPKRARN